jgi:hypothetical protein
MQVFVDLLKSKALWTMVITAVVSWLVSVLPGLDAVRAQLFDVLLWLGALVVGGFSAEAAAAAHGDAQVRAFVAQAQAAQSVAQAAKPAERPIYPSSER